MICLLKSSKISLEIARKHRLDHVCEFLGKDKALTRVKCEFVNYAAKLSEIYENVKRYQNIKIASQTSLNIF